MSAPINRKQDNVAGTGAKPWIPLNRWGNDFNYSIVLTFTGAATVTVEGTVDYLNRPNQTIVPFDIVNAVGVTSDSSINIIGTPLEGLRINQTAGAGSVEFHVMQGGASG